MGILVPQYTKTLSPPGPNGQIQAPTQLTNVYMSLRFEHLVLQQNPDGATYTISGRAKVYNSPTDIYVQDTFVFNFTLTKDQLNGPLHTLIYTYLKTQYPGATDAN
jgi:ABC-type transport system substrate-binding protein